MVLSVAIQATINAAFYAGGGIVYFPKGIYIASGVLQNPGAGIGGSPNSQLYIPRRDEMSDTGNVTIKLIGEAPPNMTYSGLTNYKLKDNCAVIYSTLTSGSGSFPSVLGADGTGLYFDLNYSVNVEVENLKILVKAKVGSGGPVISGIDMGEMANASLRNVYVAIDTALIYSNYPTAETFGIRMPGTNGGTFSNCYNTFCGGFKNGLVVSEHFNGSNIEICNVVNGIVFGPTYHGIHIDNIGIHWAINAVSGPVGAITGGIGSNPHITIDNLNTEYRQNGSWYDTRYIVNDSTNYLRGSMTYNVVEAEVGLNNSRFSKNGGTSFLCTPADVSDQSKYLVGIGTGTPTNQLHVKSTSALATVGILAEQTAITGAAQIDVKNSSGIQGGMRFYGSAHALTSFRNQFGIGSNAGIRIFSDGLVASGGTNDHRFYVGGYNDAQERLRLTPSGISIGGAANPAASALLDISSTTKGFLMPRQTTTQRDAISSPATGLQVFNTTLSTPDFYTGSQWLSLPGVIKGSAAIDFTSTTAGNSTLWDITVTGAALGDIVTVEQDKAEPNMTYSAWVESTNTVRIKAHNISASTIDPASKTFKVIIFK